MTSTQSRPYRIGQILGVAGGGCVVGIPRGDSREGITCAREKLVAPRPPPRRAPAPRPLQGRPRAAPRRRAGSKAAAPATSSGIRRPAWSSAASGAGPARSSTVAGPCCCSRSTRPFMRQLGDRIHTMVGRLIGKRAIVTGAGQGVGRGIALALANEGAAVLVAGRTLEKVERTAQEIKAAGGESLAVRCDVGVPDDVAALFGETVPDFGGLDVLVNNAQSVPPNRRLQDALIDDVELALNTGPIATFRCMQAAFPHLREGGGSIVNLGSNTAIEGAPLFGAYAM